MWVNDTDNVLGGLAPTYDVRMARQDSPTTGVAPADDQRGDDLTATR